MTVRLRPYQREAIDAVKRDWEEGITDALLVAATGSGKTVIFLQLLIEMLQAGQRALILAHRQELIHQPLERIRQFWAEWAGKAGIVMGDRNECNRQIVVATVQTLSRPGRLASLLHYGKIDYLVVDECHHSTNATYLEVIKALRRVNPELRHLGVTATPIRSDKDGLKRVYQKISYQAGIRELIKLGHLVPFKALAVQTAISLKGVRAAEDDYVQSQLANAWECDNLYDLIVATHQRYAADRPTMAFSVSVAGAHKLAERLCAVGIPAAAADATTAREDRAAIVERFKRGDIQVLCNCMLWTEGLDLPRIACIHMARPTKSDLVYVQAIGRGLRPLPGKQDCLILDYAPEDARNVVMAGDLLGKPRDQKKAEEQAEREGVVIAGFSFTGEGTGIDGDPDEIVLRPLHYMTLSPHAWYYDGRYGGLSTLGLGEYQGITRTLAIVPPNGAPLNGNTRGGGHGGIGPAVAGYRLALVQRSKDSWRDEVEVIASGEDFEALADRGAQMAEEYGVEILRDKSKPWHRNPASEKQVSLLRKLRPGDEERLETLNRGAAAKLITAELARRSLCRVGLVQ